MILVLNNERARHEHYHYHHHYSLMKRKTANSKSEMAETVRNRSVIDKSYQFVILWAQILTIFDLLNPNFDKFIHFPNFYQNLGLKGQKLSKFVPIR